MLKQIGKYTISERIGRGTYSRVYRAVDAQGRSVAIKMSTTSTEPEHLNAFQKDLVAAASVLHPSLAAVHDLGFEDDFPYLVMELVEGQDLDKLLKSNTAPSLAERIRVMQQVGEALKSAHERGVYHLDVRPSKIMRREDGTAKLLDLGLGRLSFDPSRVTENGYLLGAPFYMSPERLTAIDTAEARCDIWSYGVTFYEWLSGRHPFYDDDGDRMIGNIMDAAPAPLTNVPGPLNELILRALEKDPADRYQHFGDLLADLRPLVSDLKREESDALMAEALKQTDSGRWHEARRIARQMRDMEPQPGVSSQLFGFAEPEAEKVGERARPVMAAAATVAASARAAAATAVDTPEPAPPAMQAKIEPQPVVVRPTPLPNPQRPERTAPKIPVIGVKNGAANGENGSAATARVKVPTPETNGTHAVAAEAKPAPLVREVETAGPRMEQTRTRPPSNPRVSATAAAAPQTVRILEMEEPSGFPWLKIIAFAVPALLMIGGLFFFLQPTSKMFKPRVSSEEAKEITPAERVIKTDHTADEESKVSDAAGKTEALKAGVNSANAQPGTTSATVSPNDPVNPESVPGPKAFDPKSLVLPKAPAPNRRRGNGALAGVAPPAIGNSSADLDVGLLPVNLGAPPPPAPPVAAPTPAAGATKQVVEEANPRVGGAFSKPVLTHLVKPIYPAAARESKTQGLVTFQATIDKDGSVKNIQLVSGDPQLNLAAKQAVSQWKFQPAMLNGQPVEAVQTLIVKFTLDNQ